jgi:hypothetical protein
LVVQTFQHWACIVCDQSQTGVSERTAHEALPHRNDARVVAKRVEYVGDWGQTVKYREAIACEEEYVGFPNDDAYYVPIYLERMVRALDAGYDLVYCDWVWDQAGYQPVTVQPRVGCVDVGGFLVRRSVLQAVGWEDRSYEGDGLLVERIVNAGYTHARVQGLLYVKN